MPSSTSPSLRPPRGKYSIGFWLLLSLSFVALSGVWVIVALHTGRQAGWMTVLGALNTLFLLRLFAIRRRVSGAVIGVVTVLLLIIASNWLIASVYMGGQLSLYPWQAASRLGPSFVWHLSLIANSGSDMFWLSLGLIIATLGGR